MIPNSKTPHFDQKLDEYFHSLTLDKEGGLTLACRYSGEPFYVRPQDVAWSKKIKVPLPTLSPNERARRRQSYINSYNLYRIVSAHSGKPCIAMYPKDTPFKIYEHEVWHSDAWDPIAFGRELNLEESFLENFKRLQLAVPRPNLISDSTNINSPYTNCSYGLKDSYLAFNSKTGENLYYFDGNEDNRNCLSSMDLWSCDTCAHCRDCRNCYKVFHSEICRDCLESSFLVDCKNCDHCFMFSGLRHKKYCLGNVSLTKAEYEHKLAQIETGAYSVHVKLWEEFKALKARRPRRALHNFRAENCLGDYIENSKNIFMSNFVYTSENVAYTLGTANSRDSYDLCGGFGTELCYELASVSTENNFNCRFSYQLSNCRDIEYSELCANCTNCFGCIGLQNKSFCILNNRYSEEEYWSLLDKIKMRMLQQNKILDLQDLSSLQDITKTSGLVQVASSVEESRDPAKKSVLADQSYGEFFPPSLHPIPYKTSLAANYKGFRDYKNATRYGYDMRETEDEVKKTEVTLPARSLPNNIKDIKDDILQKIIISELSGKPFIITPFELKFYRAHALPLPREHQLLNLSAFREEYDAKLVLHNTLCSDCKRPVLTSRVLSSGEVILCDNCYVRQVS